jgi:sulfate permease, SulP family
MLGELVDQLEASGVTLHLAALRGPVSDVLGRAAWFRDLCRAGRVHDTVVRAVEALPLDLRDEEPERSRDRDGVSR